MQKQEYDRVQSRQACLSFCNKHKHILILAPQGTGVTTLVKALPHAAYIDLSRASLTPEGFAEELSAYAPASPAAQRIRNELEKIKPNQQQLLIDAIACLGTLKGRIIFEHYEHLLDFSNYPQLKDIENTLETELLKLNIICTSTKVGRLTTHPTKQLQTVYYAGLDEQETEDLCRKHGLQRAAAKEIFAFCNGNAFLTASIAQRAKEMPVKEAIAVELIWQHAPAYTHFHSIYTSLLADARGATLLRTILKALATEDSIRLNALSRKIYRSAPVTKSLVDRLIEVGLVVRTDNLFALPAPLRTWLRIYFSGQDTPAMPTKKQLEVLL